MNVTRTAQLHSNITSKGAPACIYLDHAASTPLDPCVLNHIYGILSQEVCGNTGAKHHSFGVTAARTVESARHQVALAVGADAAEIIFTSGATESNNLSIKGLARHLKGTGKTHIVATAVEHKSVLGPLQQLQADGFDVTIVPVKPCGMVTPEMIERTCHARTGLVCVQAVNNELGTIQPLAQIAALLSDRNILLHCDAAQALGKMPFSVADTGVDFASFSAHKANGPQGIGALYIKSDKRALLQPLQSGGGQEFALRSGTLPVALCAGFGTACALLPGTNASSLHASMQTRFAHMRHLRAQFLAQLAPLNPIIHGRRDPDGNAPGIINIRFPGIDNDTLSMALPGLAFSLGSACSSNTASKPSHVIMAITGDERAAKESIRISFGHTTTELELAQAAEQIHTAVTEIRELQEVA